TPTSPRPRRCTLPATRNRPDSSASRSQSASGAIAASSFRRSSESTLELQEAPLVTEAERAIRPEVTGGDHAVAGDEETEAVACAERAGRAGGAGGAGERGQLAVRDHLAPRDRPERLGAAREELAVVLEVDRDVLERNRVAGEVRPNQGHDRIPMSVDDR